MTADPYRPLPKWAQRHIADLERQLAAARKERDEALTVHPRSPVAVVRSEGFQGDGPKEIYLDRDATIRFHVGADEMLDVIEATFIENSVRIQGWAQIRVKPIAANSVVIVPERRYEP